MRILALGLRMNASASSWKWRPTVRRRGPPRYRPALRQAGHPSPTGPLASVRVPPINPPPSCLARFGFGPHSAIEALCLYGSFCPFCHSVQNRPVKVGQARSCHPAFRTRDPKPETRDPKPRTRDPKPRTRDPKPRTRKESSPVKVYVGGPPGGMNHCGTIELQPAFNPFNSF